MKRRRDWFIVASSAGIGLCVACAAQSGVGRAAPPQGLDSPRRSTSLARGETAVSEQQPASELRDNPELPSLAAPDESEAACPGEMSLVSAVGHDYCIDRFEASIQRRLPSGETKHWPGNKPVDGIEHEIVAVVLPGEKPQGYINALQARVACERAEKRLCTSEEWIAACRGPMDTTYPYGNQRRAGVCNDRFKGTAGHPVVRLFRENAPPGTDPKLMWTAPWMNDPRLHEFPDTVAPTGAFVDCVNEYGVADMVGNLHEWVADEHGVFRGGYFMDTYQHGEGCDYRTTSHPVKYRDYSTGFRCCADPDR